GCAVLAESDCLHHLGSCGYRPTAIVSRSPVGELQPDKQDQQNNACSPFGDALYFHDSMGRAGNAILVKVPSTFISRSGEGSLRVERFQRVDARSAARGKPGGD